MKGLSEERHSSACYKGKLGTQSPDEDNRIRPMPLIKDESPLNLKGPRREVICAVKTQIFFFFTVLF